MHPILTLTLTLSLQFCNDIGTPVCHLPLVDQERPPCSTNCGTDLSELEPRERYPVELLFPRKNFVVPSLESCNNSNPFLLHRRAQERPDRHVASRRRIQWEAVPLSTPRSTCSACPRTLPLPVRNERSGTGDRPPRTCRSPASHVVACWLRLTRPVSPRKPPTDSDVSERIHQLRSKMKILQPTFATYLSSFLLIVVSRAATTSTPTHPESSFVTVSTPVKRNQLFLRLAAPLRMHLTSRRSCTKVLCLLFCDDADIRESREHARDHHGGSESNFSGTEKACATARTSSFLTTKTISASTRSRQSVQEISDSCGWSIILRIDSEMNEPRCLSTSSKTQANWDHRWRQAILM